MDEKQWDKLLKIKTTGRDDSRSDPYHYPYEPTPYEVLERLSLQGYIGKDNTLVDYGCGKGRVSFFLAYQTKCRSIGVDFNERLYEKALENKESCVSGSRTEFVCGYAEKYKIDARADRFYFFNPFSIEIFHKVMGRIRESYYEKPRKMLLFFYYPSEEYLSYLRSLDEVTQIDCIECTDLFNGLKEREKVLVFDIGASLEL